MLTVDTATIARPRDLPYDERASVPSAITLREAMRFAPAGVAKPRWLADYLRRDPLEPQVAMGLRPDGTPMGLFEGIEHIYQQTPAWDDVPWMRKHWDGPIVIKGILTAEDARRAVAVGVDAIVVSNHGGNVLDGSLATLRALPEIVDAVGDEIEVLMDGGVRRGTDVVKAVALGARAVLLGRAYVYPLLAAGEPGVHRILECCTSRSTRRSRSWAWSRSTTSTRRCSTFRPTGLSAGRGSPPRSRPDDHDDPAPRP